MSAPDRHTTIDPESIRTVAECLKGAAGDMEGDFCFAAINGGHTEHVAVPNGPHAVDKMVEAGALLAATPGNNVYFVPAIFRTGAIKGNQGRTQKNVIATLAAIMDFDSGHDPATRHDRLPLQPHGEVETSPGNFQCHYWFDKPVAPGNARLLTERLVADAKSDNCVSADHLFRLPGTFNYPTAKKIAAGRSPEPFAIRFKISPEEWERTTLEDLNTAVTAKYGAAVVEEKKKPSSAKGETAPAPAVRDALGYINPSRPYPEWVKVIAGIRAAPNCPEAREIAHEWSCGELDRHGRFKDGPPPEYLGKGKDEVDRVFDSVPPKDDGITIATVFDMAQKEGWTGNPFVRPTAEESIGADVLERLIAEQEAGTECQPHYKQASSKFFQDRGDFQDRPPAKWVLDKIIRENTDVCLVGPSQHLKSEVIAHLGGDWRRNDNFLGDIAIAIPKDQRGPVFDASAEDPDFFGEVRITSWEMKYGDGPFSCNGFYVLDDIPQLGDLESQDRFIAEVRARTPKGQRPIIFFDTLIQALNGNPEDSSTTMADYVRMAKRIRRKTNAYCTISAHHMGWEAKRSRGSSALYQGMDTMIYLTDRVQAGDAFIVKMTMDKVKQGRAGAVRYLRSVPIMTPKGEGFALDFTSQPAASRGERNNARFADDTYSTICRSLLAEEMIRPKVCDTDAMLRHWADQQHEIDDSMTGPQIKSALTRVRSALRRAAKKDSRIDALTSRTEGNQLRWGLTKDQAALVCDPIEDQGGHGSEGDTE